MAWAQAPCRCCAIKRPLPCCLPRRPRAYPASWAEPRLTHRDIVVRHFDSTLPEEWSELFERVMTDIFSILGGGFPFHAVVTHTHMQDTASPEAKRVLREVGELIDVRRTHRLERL